MQDAKLQKQKVINLKSVQFVDKDVIVQLNVKETIGLKFTTNSVKILKKNRMRNLFKKMRNKRKKLKYCKEFLIQLHS